MIRVLLLLGCAVAIYAACEWFVNAAEWLGVRLQVSPVAVGTILAALGVGAVYLVLAVVGGLPLTV